VKGSIVAEFFTQSLSLIWISSYLLSLYFVYKKSIVPRHRLFIASLYQPLVIFVIAVDKKLEPLSSIPQVIGLFSLTLIVFAASNPDVIFFILYPYAWLYDKLKRTTNEKAITNKLYETLYQTKRESFAIGTLVAFFWLLAVGWITAGVPFNI
jgi:hypothetical protein